MKNNQKNLAERTFELLITQMFAKLKMGRADWDLDHLLRSAFIAQKSEIAYELNRYDHIMQLTKKSKTKVSAKYEVLYDLHREEN